MSGGHSAARKSDGKRLLMTAAFDRDLPSYLQLHATCPPTPAALKASPPPPCLPTWQSVPAADPLHLAPAQAPSAAAGLSPRVQ
eukprot:CAMPEP_0197690452 /NCGR_PEP_ID=MMETSP1338-20131121/108367_1 /TAXON_ID=43686 ORGANISM="Pelagodinium beii, Strain RCC1491" /NCGR_SAMPLE_ID=MMETSP1338 /ASSEMBLY_ACC=CAM_ASM_000754 /LENGTH=83 /DNA_ID=CAMNT_0043272905 /DNA_START=64 /DNA_END=315 /DNA_ORIENTATION=+